MFSRTQYRSGGTNVSNVTLTSDQEASAFIIDRVQHLLLGSGAGFAFVGKQVHSQIGDDAFYIHLLYYHLKLRCYVIVELRSARFDTAFLGTIDFFMRTTDVLMRHPDDRPTIGILLYRSNTKTVVKYALPSPNNDPNAPNEVQLVEDLPDQLAGHFPAAKEIARAVCM
jgi:hypothetical protein